MMATHCEQNMTTNAPTQAIDPPSTRTPTILTYSSIIVILVSLVVACASAYFGSLIALVIAAFGVMLGTVVKIATQKGYRDGMKRDRLPSSK
jgi:hypothetical protein